MAVADNEIGDSAHRTDALDQAAIDGVPQPISDDRSLTPALREMNKVRSSLNIRLATPTGFKVIYYQCFRALVNAALSPSQEEGGRSGGGPRMCPAPALTDLTRRGSGRHRH